MSWQLKSPEFKTSLITTTATIPREYQNKANILTNTLKWIFLYIQWNIRDWKEMVQDRKTGCFYTIKNLDYSLNDTKSHARRLDSSSLLSSIEYFIKYLSESVSQEELLLRTVLWRDANLMIHRTLSKSATTHMICGWLRHENVIKLTLIPSVLIKKKLRIIGCSILHTRSSEMLDLSALTSINYWRNTGYPQIISVEPSDIRNVSV